MTLHSEASEGAILNYLAGTSDLGDAAAIRRIAALVGAMIGGGSPEGVLTGSVGALYTDSTNGVLYIKATGTGNTGWTAVGGGGSVAIDDLTDAYRDGTAKNLWLGSNIPAGLSGATDNISISGDGVALDSITSGDQNVAIGTDAGTGITTASFNTIVGSNAGKLALGNSNTIVGSGAGSSASKIGSTLIGYFAAGAGDYATVVGYDSSANAAGSVAIGCSSAGGGATTSVADEIVLGTALHTTYTKGGRRKAIVAKTTTYAAAKTDHIINATSGTFTVTLPTAVSDTGREFVLKNSGTGVLTIATTSSQTIDGSTTRTLNQYDSLTVVSDGANWIVI